MQPSILDEEYVPTESRSVGEDDALRLRADIRVGDDLVGLATDVDCHTLRHR
ncbi:Uncharacterised protein [Mycobacteroides abscessus subsp. abscessus]|nr:Uncharacterised protein [Mycobacteroides abscessus subsp. abscessus]